MLALDLVRGSLDSDERATWITERIGEIRAELLRPRAWRAVNILAAELVERGDLSGHEAVNATAFLREMER